MGASADLMQGFIRRRSQSRCRRQGVDYVTSQTPASASHRVGTHAPLSTDPNAALTEVTAKVQQVRAQLPTDAEDPVIMKGTGQTFALMYLTFASSEMNSEQAFRNFSPANPPGSRPSRASAAPKSLAGANSPCGLVDPQRLAARGATASDVVTAIRASNFLAAPGKTKNEFVAYALEMQTTFQTPETFATLPIRANGDQVVRLRDVADVELGPKSTDTKVSFNGKEGTFIGITPTPAANPLTVASAVTKAIDEIRPTLPKGMTVEIVYDASDFIS